MRPTQAGPRSAVVFEAEATNSARQNGSVEHDEESHPQQDAGTATQSHGRQLCSEGIERVISAAKTTNIPPSQMFRLQAGTAVVQKMPLR